MASNSKISVEEKLERNGMIQGKKIIIIYLIVCEGGCRCISKYSSSQRFHHSPGLLLVASFAKSRSICIDSVTRQGAQSFIKDRYWS